MYRGFIFRALFAVLGSGGLLWAQTSAPVQLESTTGLGPATSMISDASGALYIAGPASTVLGQSVPVRTPPGGVVSLVSDGGPALSYVARVRPEGDVVFWVMLLPMSVQDLKLDPQGNLWAAGIAVRSPSASDVTPCFSTNNPTAEPGGTAPAILRLSGDGRSAPIFQCIGRGWQINPADGLAVRLTFDPLGNIYLAGDSTAYRGFSPTPGAAMPTPGDAPPAAYAGVFTPYAIKLDPSAASIQYATWLPGDRVTAVSADAAGVLTIGGSANEAHQQPSLSGAAQPNPGGGVLLRTQDGGQTWQNAANGLPGAPVAVVVARRNVNALLAWSLQWIALSADGGRSWTQMPPPPDVRSGPYLRSLAIDDGGQAVYLLEADYAGGASLSRYQDGQWTSLRTPPSLNLSTASLAAGAGSTVYLFQGGIWYSPDAGSTWQIDAPDSSPYVLTAHPADGRFVYRIAPGAAGFVYQQTVDYGKSWTTFNAPSNTIVPSVNDPNLLIASTALNLYRSLDGGQHWQTYAGLGCAGARPNPTNAGSVLCLDRSAAATKTDLSSKQVSIYQPILGAAPILGLPGAAVSASQFYLLRSARKDGLVCRLDSAGAQFQVCTYLGGLGDDAVTLLTPASKGGFWVAGTSNSRDFPVSPGALQKTVRFYTDDGNFSVAESSDVFLCRLSADARQWSACTLFGGSLDETAIGLFEDSQGRPMLLGNTVSWDFPIAGGGQASPYTSKPQFVFNLLSSGFLMRTDAALTQASFASVLTPIAIGAAASAGVDAAAYAGKDSSSAPWDYLGPQFFDAASSTIGVFDFSGALSADIFPYGLREPVFYTGLSLTPGGVVILTGSGVSTAVQSGTTDPLPRQMATVQVMLDGQTAPLFFVSPSQINFQTPWTASPGVHTLQVTRTGVKTPLVPIWLFPAVPIQFIDPLTRYPIAFNEDGSRHDAKHPAAPGSMLTVWFSGAGNVYSAPAPGQRAKGPAPSVYPATAMVGPYQGDVWYTGVAPGTVGVSEVQFRVPDVPDGEYPLWLVMNGLESNRTSISIRTPR